MTWYNLWAYQNGCSGSEHSDAACDELYLCLILKFILKLRCPYYRTLRQTRVNEKIEYYLHIFEASSVSEEVVRYGGDFVVLQKPSCRERNGGVLLIFA